MLRFRSPAWMKRPMTHLRRRLQAASPANRRIAWSLVLITALMFVSRVIDTGRELVVANSFGLSDVVDAYVLAFMVPKFFITMVADSFAVAFLPSYVAAREHNGLRAARELLGKATVRLSLALLLIIVTLIAMKPIVLDLLAPSFSSETIALTATLYFLLLPVLLLTGCSRLWAMILNAAERYTLTSLAPAMVPLIGIIFLVAAAEQFGIQALAIGTVVGSLIELVILGSRVWSFESNSTSVAPTVRLPLRRTSQGWWPLAVSAGLMASTIPVDQYMASSLGSGNVSALVFGTRLVMFIVGISSMALSATLFPRFSTLAVSGHWDELSRLLRTWTKVVAVVSVPATLALMILSPLIVRTLFERGDFSSHATSVVAGVQALYLIQLPFYIVSTLCVRVLNSLGCNRWLAGVATVNVVLNVVGNLALMPLLGVSGIALSTSIVYASSTIILFLIARKYLARRTFSDGIIPQEEHVPVAEHAPLDGPKPSSSYPQCAISMGAEPFEQVVRR